MPVFVKLHNDTTGEIIYVNASEIQTIERVEGGGKVCTSISLGSSDELVKESPDEIVCMIHKIVNNVANGIARVMKSWGIR